MMLRTSVEKATTTTTTTTTGNNQWRIRKRGLRLFSDDDSSNNNHHHESNNSEGMDLDDEDETTVILKFSVQHNEYPTVASILDWKFVEDMKLILQHYLCLESPLTIVHVEGNDNDEEEEEGGGGGGGGENNSTIITSLCSNKDFDHTSGQLLHPTALLTDGYNETDKMQWIGWEMRYPIWKVGESFLEAASNTDTRLTGSEMMSDVAREALNTGIIDGSFDKLLNDWNISSKISVEGREFEFFGEGADNDDSLSDGGLEPIDEDAIIMRIIGFFLLGLDTIAAFGLTWLAKRQRVAKEERARMNEQQQEPNSFLHSSLDEMLLASRQGIIASAAATASSSTPKRLRRGGGEGTTRRRNDEAIDYSHLLRDEELAKGRSPGFMMNPDRKLSTIFSEELVVAADNSKTEDRQRSSSRRFSSESFPAISTSLAAASFPNRLLPNVSHKFT